MIKNIKDFLFRDKKMKENQILEELKLHDQIMEKRKKVREEKIWNLIHKKLPYWIKDEQRSRFFKE